MVWTLNRERCGDGGLVENFHQEHARAALHELGARRTVLNFHPTFRADMHGRKHVAVEDLQQTSGADALIGHRHGLIDGVAVGPRQRLSKILQRALEASRLLRQWLQRNEGARRRRRLLRVERQRQAGERDGYDRARVQGCHSARMPGREGANGQSAKVRRGHLRTLAR